MSLKMNGNLIKCRLFYVAHLWIPIRRWSRHSLGINALVCHPSVIMHFTKTTPVSEHYCFFTITTVPWMCCLPYIDILFTHYPNRACLRWGAVQACDHHLWPGAIGYDLHRRLAVTAGRHFCLLLLWFWRMDEGGRDGLHPTGSAHAHLKINILNY